MGKGRKLREALAGKRTTMQAMWDYAQDPKARGAQAEIGFQKQLAAHPMGAFHQFARFPEMKALEEKIPAGRRREEVRRRDRAVDKLLIKSNSYISSLVRRTCPPCAGTFPSRS